MQICLYFSLGVSDGMPSSNPSDSENTPSPSILIVWPSGIQLTIVDTSASNTARITPSLMLAE